MNRKAIILLTFLSAACFVFPQTSGDQTGRILNMLDNMLDKAEEAGRNAAASPANRAAGQFSFYILNDTGFTLKEIFVCPAGSDNWGTSIFSGVLYNGHNTLINLPASPGEKGRYNIKAVDADGDKYVKRDISIAAFEIVRMSINEFEFEK
jgi:hypothetical protein